MRALILLLLINSAVAQDIPLAAWEYREAMQESAWEVFGPDAPIATLAAQIHQESAWRIDAVSWAGAEGLGQFMPVTAKDMAARFPSFCSPPDPYDAEWQFRCRDRYLRAEMRAQRTPGTTECDYWAFGLRAYNGGGSRIKKDRALTAAMGFNPDSWLDVAMFNAGRRASAYKENKEYPERIYRLEFRYRSWGRGLECLTP